MLARTDSNSSQPPASPNAAMEGPAAEPCGAPRSAPVYHDGPRQHRDPLRRLDGAIVSLLAALTATETVGLDHARAAALHELFAAIEDAEALLPADALRARLNAVRREIGRSPLAWRLQTWPRGYQGDFETIEMMCRGDGAASLRGAARWIERWALSCPPVQQHRNKIARQAALMRDVLLRPVTCPPGKVLSIACGPSRDVRQLAPIAHACRGEVWLNDADDDALLLSRERLSGVPLRCHFVPGNVFRLARTLSAAGPFDLVLAGGLFDYLTERQAIHLIERALAMLAPGGQFFFTNIVAGHAYRTCMEHVVSWTLIARSEAEVFDLCRRAGAAADRVQVETDETGLALLVTVRREHGGA